MVYGHVEYLTVEILQILSDLLFTHHFTSFDIGALLDKVEPAISALLTFGGDA